MAYTDMTSVEPGKRFKTRAGLVVETTGVTQYIESTDHHVHEVVIVEGAGVGSKYLLHLDYAEEL